MPNLPTAPSENTRKEPSLLREMPFGNCTFFTRTMVSSVVGLYLKTLPLASAEKTNCRKFLEIEGTTEQ